MKHSFFFAPIASLALFITLGLFTASDKDLVDDVLEHTNKFRKSKGLPALLLNEDLNDIAQKHSANMASGRTAFGHSGFNQREKAAKKKIRNATAFGENVAYGATSGKEVVTMWKNSTGHRRNILGDYKYIGIGTAKDRRGYIYFTQVFID
jgi:uncharacterized protein YkwD